MLHGVRVMRRRRALIKPLALFNRQRVAGSNTFDTAKNFHYSPLDPIGGWARIFVVEQQTYGSSTHFYALSRMSSTCGRYLFGQEPDE